MPHVWKVTPRKKEELTEQLLLNRGIKTEAEKEDFFHPKLLTFEKDLQIPGIKKSQDRIKKAIKNEELIMVYGDYDVDGLCSSAICYKALASIGARVLPYIPHREKEGYGLSKLGLDFCKEKGASLVITVDNGIVALEQAKYAKKLGMDLIITDHHLPLDEKPEADAIVHSTKMCGASVVWCLVRGMVDKDLYQELLQFAAIATVADMIPLIGLGRAFVVEGLRYLNKTENVGLKALFIESGLIKGNIGSYEIGYIIAPRLNAIGRLEHAIDALRLLCTNDPKKARGLARVLGEANDRRRKLTADALLEAGLKLNPLNKIHIVHSPNWAAGIVGLVAAKVCEETNQPSIAMAIGETFARGSARSVDGINIVDVIRQCSDLLIDIGGHSGAAGFTIPNENIEEFEKRLQEIAQGFPDEIEKILEIEAEVESKKLTKTLEREISKMEPFGFGNPRPLLATRNMKISDIRVLSDGKHLKFKAEDIDAIAFGMGNIGEFLQEGQMVDMAYFLELNKFNGSEMLQLRVRDLQLK